METVFQRFVSKERTVGALEAARRINTPVRIVDLWSSIMFIYLFDSYCGLLPE